LKLVTHCFTKVQRAASHIEDPCLSIGSHSAAAFTVFFYHTSYICRALQNSAAGQLMSLFSHANYGGGERGSEFVSSHIS